MEIIETCPSFGHNTSTTIVSVRKELPERLSEPIKRKFKVALSASGGRGVGPSTGVSGRGGAATVGKSELKSTVAVGCGGGDGVGEGVLVGKNGSRVGTSM
jgi:hypothetical protein